MAQIIYKFKLKNLYQQWVELPKDAKILSAWNQNERICLWVKLNPDKEKISRLIEIYSTGELFEESDKLSFIGTVHLGNGSDVYHVFERLSS